MSSSTPKFRTNLTVSEQRTAKGVSFVVKDPASGQYFYFGEVERFLSQQFDGHTPIETARKKAEQKFGASLSPDVLTSFLRNCEKAGLIEAELYSSQKKRAEKNEHSSHSTHSSRSSYSSKSVQSGRIKGSLLFLRFKIFDPDRLFDRLYPWVRFCFTPLFVVVSAALILLGMMIIVENWDVFTQDLSSLYELSSIPLIMAVIFFVISLHEFAHGLTCKHFGGEVHEIGFLLMYFQPALYCNVSDAWLFPEKLKRLLVGFAGPYFELFLWALATMTWRWTDADTLINSLSLIVMAGSGIKTFLNFNPFIKLDGYYLLSDYLEIPNLRRKAFRYVGNLVKRLVGLGYPMGDEISGRERRIFLLYGFVASIGSFSLLAYIIFTAGGYLLEQSQPLALTLLTMLVGFKFRRKLRRIFGKGGDSSDQEDDGEEFQSSRSTRMEESSEPKKRRSRRWKRRVMWVAAAGAAVLIMFFGRMELRVSGPFAVLPVHNADVRTEIDGIIEEIYVTEGEQVKEGQLLAKLSVRENTSELQKTEAQIQQSRAKLRMQEVGPTREEITLAQTSVEKARDRLKFARGRLERDKIQIEKNLIAQKEFENTQEAATTAENDLIEAENKLKVLLKGTRWEEIQATRAEIARLEIQQKYLQGSLERAEVRSPVAGILATPARQLREMIGQAVSKGALVAKVYDLKKITVEIAVPEKEIADVEVGQTVALKARAYPDDTFYGVVTSVATAARGGAPSGTGNSPGPGLSPSPSTGKTILVTTEIDNTELLLKPEMTGQSKIFCGEQRFIDLLMRRLALTFKVEFWSWW